ncbi:ribonuclease H-like domain-containing protein [Tanacetum coccineum]
MKARTLRAPPRTPPQDDTAPKVTLLHTPGRPLKLNLSGSRTTPHPPCRCTTAPTTAREPNDDVPLLQHGREAPKKNDVKARSMMLNQSYENFNAPSTKSLDSIFNRLQKIVSQLAILGENISQEDLNLKFLRNYEQEVKRSGTSSSNSSSQNIAFVSTPGSTNEANTVNTANSSVSTDYLEQIHEDDLEEIDLKWQLALLSMRARKYYQRTRKKITINGSDTAGYDKSKVECFNCHKMGHFARECRGPRNQESKLRNQDSSRRTVNVEDTSSKAMVAIDGAGFDWSFMAEEEVTTNMAFMAFSDSKVYNDKTCSNTYQKLEDSLNTQLDNLKSRKGVGYNDVPPPPTGLFAPLIIDLSYSGLEEFQQLEFEMPQWTLSKSFDHIQAHCKYHQRERMVYRNNYNRVNYNYTTNRTHPNAQRNMVPRAVLMKTGLKSFNTARTVNTAHPKSTVYSAKPMSCFSKSAQSTVKRPYQSKTVLTNKNFSQKVNTAKVKVNTVRPKAVNTARPNSAVVNTVRANQANAVKASACWVWRPTKLDSASITLKKHNYIDARGRSKSISRSLMEDMLPLEEESEEERSLVKGVMFPIPNTLDPSASFDGKSDDGFFVRYSLTSKAFRVYNIRTRKVEENLHIRFLEDKPIVLGNGPKWLFDIDSLTKSMNYVPVNAGTNSNDFAGSEVSIGEDPLLFDSPSMNVSHDEPELSCDAEKKDDEGVSKENGVDDQEKPESSTPNINTDGPSINTASANLKTGIKKIGRCSLIVENIP